MRPADIIGIEALEKLRAAGFEVVPVEPTEEMIAAYRGEADKPGFYVFDAEHQWKAMLAASPNPGA